MLTLINIYFYQHDQGCINRTQKLALVLLGELLGSCIFWGLSIDVSADISVNCQSIYRLLCWLILGRLSNDVLVTLSCYSLSVDSPPILCRQIIDISPTIGH